MIWKELEIEIEMGREMQMGKERAIEGVEIEEGLYSVQYNGDG